MNAYKVFAKTLERMEEPDQAAYTVLTHDCKGGNLSKSLEEWILIVNVAT